MNDAIHYVHALKIKTQREWLDFCKNPANQVPENIPRRPDVVYNQWVSWNHWLGNKPVEALQAKVEAQKTAVFYIIHEQDVPGNVFTYGVEQTGISAVKEWWDREQFDIVKLFWYEPDKGTVIKNIIDILSTPYIGDDKQRITPNVWMIVEELQLIMNTILKV
jgi:hypothetical protein